MAFAICLILDPEKTAMIFSYIKEHNNLLILELRPVQS